ncbi:MAG: FKBP-type peptidyl-prolyl cis-trans isomerase [bacterium]
MNNKILIIVLLLIIVGLIYYFGFYEKKGVEEEQIQLPNPAAVYCQEQGGILENIAFEGGSRGFCLFDDGSQCSQWDFYREECGKGQLKIKIIKEGTGKLADTGNRVAVHYTGTFFENDAEFDSSLRAGRPFVFNLGGGQVISGWEQGVLGMKIGEKRKLTIAPGLAYGNSGIPGVIPPGATLVFEIDLLEIQ